MEKLKAWTEANGQTKLAYLSGVSQAAVAQWLAKGIVPHKRVKRVSEVTGIPVAELNPDFDVGARLSPAGEK